MTKNQIEFWKHQEQKRANAANEAETARANREREAHNVRLLEESRWVNRANLSETGRHNMETERQARSDLLERTRSNLASEGNTAQRNAVEFAKVTEQARTNIANESLKHAANVIAGRQADTAQFSAEDISNYRSGQLGIGITQTKLDQQRLDEQKRANQASEALRSLEIGARTGTEVLGTLGSFFGRVISGRRGR